MYRYGVLFHTNLSGVRIYSISLDIASIWFCVPWFTLGWFCQGNNSLYCAYHVKPAAGQRRPRAPQLLQEALCTAPAMRKAARKLSVLRLPREASRAAAPSGGSVYCACHTKASRGPAAPMRAAAPPGGSVYCACHAKGSQEALCTAPSTRSQPRPSGAHARRSSFRRLCVLRLLHKSQPRPSGAHARRSSSRCEKAPCTDL